jgi:hypothetical protein
LLPRTTLRICSLVTRTNVVDSMLDVSLRTQTIDASDCVHKQTVG